MCRRIIPAQEFIIFVRRVTTLESELLNAKLEALLVKINSNDRNIATRLDGMDKANDLKSQTLDHKLSELNDLRKAVEKDRIGFVRKETYEDRIEVLNDKLDSLDRSISAVRTDTNTGDNAIRNELGISINDIKNRVTAVETRLITTAGIIVFIVAIIEAFAHYFKG